MENSVLETCPAVSGLNNDGRFMENTRWATWIGISCRQHNKSKMASDCISRRLLWIYQVSFSFYTAIKASQCTYISPSSWSIAVCCGSPNRTGSWWCLNKEENSWNLRSFIYLFVLESALLKTCSHNEPPINKTEMNRNEHVPCTTDNGRGRFSDTRFAQWGIFITLVFLI